MKFAQEIGITIIQLYCYVHLCLNLNQNKTKWALSDNDWEVFMCMTEDMMNSTYTTKFNQ